jgi:hypothetical protein
MIEKYTEEDIDTVPVPVKYGVFLVLHSCTIRSGDIQGEFDTRSEAWQAVIEACKFNGLDISDYEVRAVTSKGT